MDGHVIQLIKKYRHLPGPFKCYPLCANKREKYCKCPWDSSSHFFLMISTESCISPPRTVKTAPSFPGTCESCWSAGLTPFPPLHRSLSAGTAAEHLGTARNGNKLRRKGQGQSGVAQLPEPSFGLCASVFHHLFAARKFRGELQGQKFQGGSQAAARRTAFPGGCFPGGCGEKERKCMFDAERKEDWASG